jgi:hypothetical protein
MRPQPRPPIPVTHLQKRKVAALLLVIIWACTVATVLIVAGIVLVLMAKPVGFPCVVLGGWLFRVILHRGAPGKLITPIRAQRNDLEELV